MLKRAKRLLLLGVVAALGLSLCACDAKLDETILNNEADYSVNIQLPYVTVTPPPASKVESQALEISSDGSVTVNDAAILDESTVSGTDSDSNYKSLRQGNTGLAVQVLQTRLEELGYLKTGVTGIFDAETEAAVRRFEQTYGTMQTGVATANLQQRLFSPDALTYASAAYNNAVVAQYRILRRGDAGSSVYALQQRLMNLGYPITHLTGTFDAETAAAVELFYEAYGLSRSDIANVALQKEIYSDSARAYADAADRTTLTLSGNIPELQRRLIELGYLGGSVTGEEDAQTQIAEKLFEQACGELASNTMSERVLNMLSSDTAPTFADAYSQYQNLIEGSGGEEVVRLQQRLIDLGFAAGAPNGEYGSATSASVRLFQQANGMEETGAATSYVQAVLYSSFALNINGEYAISANDTQGEVVEDIEKPVETVSDILSSGSSGDDVLKLQNRLTELGYISSVTGEYDSLTGRGVATFQEAIGMETNGVADMALLKFLYSNAAPHFGTTFYSSPRSYQTLTEGDSGDAVTQLQKQLWNLGYLPTDGVRNSVGTFNDATTQAVTDFQSAVGYDEPDGIASPEIQCFLFSDAAKSYAQN